MLTTLHGGYHILKRAGSSLEPGERPLRSQWKLVLLEGFLGHMVERPRREWEEKPGPKRSSVMKLLWLGDPPAFLHLLLCTELC